MHSSMRLDDLQTVTPMAGAVGPSETARPFQMVRESRPRSTTAFQALLQEGDFDAHAARRFPSISCTAAMDWNTPHPRRIELKGLGLGGPSSAIKPSSSAQRPGALDSVHFQREIRWCMACFIHAQFTWSTRSFPLKARSVVVVEATPAHPLGSFERQSSRWPPGDP